MFSTYPAILWGPPWGLPGNVLVTRQSFGPPPWGLPGKSLVLTQQVFGAYPAMFSTYLASPRCLPGNPLGPPLWGLPGNVFDLPGNPLGPPSGAYPAMFSVLTQQCFRLTRQCFRPAWQSFRALFGAYPAIPWAINITKYTRLPGNSSRPAEAWPARANLNLTMSLGPEISPCPNLTMSPRSGTSPWSGILTISPLSGRALYASPSRPSQMAKSHPAYPARSPLWSGILLSPFHLLQFLYLQFFFYLSSSSNLSEPLAPFVMLP